MKRVVISNHSQHKALCEKIAEALRTASHDIITVDESFPQLLKLREQAIRWCEVFVLVASVTYQRDPYCLELANYAKTIRKPIVTVLGQSNYQPYGSIGAISVAGAAIIDFTMKEDFDRAFECLKNELESIELISSISKPDLPRRFKSPENSGKMVEKCNGIFVSYQSDTCNIAKMVEAALSSYENITLGDPSKCSPEAISSCQVFVAILSPAYQTSEESQRSYEFAREHRKQIIQVIGAKGYQPTGWLALAIAGKLYYAMPDHETAYKPFYDSSLMKDFCYAVRASLQPQSSEEEREKAEIQALDKQLEECKNKLRDWPPKARPKEQVPVRQAEAAAKELKTNLEKESLPLHYIHHDVARMSFVPPKPLFDARGVPIQRKFDAMCSYQWVIQRFVRDFYMDLHLRNVDVWMDIWGGMQGNINESMANAVECSSVIVCFLTAQYQKSVNCCLELKYALHCQKPVIFIKVEPNLMLLPWIANEVARSKIFEMSSIDDAGALDDGIPRINRIAELIRRYSTLRPAVEDDVSEEVLA